MKILKYLKRGSKGAIIGFILGLMILTFQTVFKDNEPKDQVKGSSYYIDEEKQEYDVAAEEDEVLRLLGIVEEKEPTSNQTKHEILKAENSIWNNKPYYQSFIQVIIRQIVVADTNNAVQNLLQIKNEELLCSAINFIYSIDSLQSSQYIKNTYSVIAHNSISSISCDNIDYLITRANMESELGHHCAERLTLQAAAKKLLDEINDDKNQKIIPIVHVENSAEQSDQFSSTAIQDAEMYEDTSSKRAIKWKPSFIPILLSCIGFVFSTAFKPILENAGKVLMNSLFAKLFKGKKSSKALDSKNSDKE